MRATGLTPQQNRRRIAMAVLSHAATQDIASHLESIDVPDHAPLRLPQNGLVMLRGRIGGDGAPFNLGEATVSRAAVRLRSGEIGFGYTLGRDGDKARLIAMCDALIQHDGFADAVEAKVIAPLRAQHDESTRRKAAETAATKVDFYTLVRGDS